MKKILIILSLLSGFNNAHGYNKDAVDSIVNTEWFRGLGTPSTKDQYREELQNTIITTPDFSLIDIEGNMHTNESTKGKYLVINFWATWCPPCLKEIPAFVEFYEKNSDRAEILGLNYEQADKKTILEFTDTFMVNYPIILFNDKNGSQFTNFGDVFGMPTTYIYNPEGRLVDFRIGEIDIETLEKSIL